MPLADQGIVSAGTFSFNVLLARLLPLDDYGRYALILGCMSLAQGFCASLVVYPLSVRSVTLDERQRSGMVYSALIVTIIGSLPVALIVCSVLTLFVGAKVLIPAFAMIVAGQVQEVARRSQFVSSGAATAIPGDALSYAGQGLLLFALSGLFNISLPLALWIVTLTSSLAAALQVLQLRLSHTSVLAIGPLLTEFWEIGRWSLSSTLLSIARGQGLPWLLAAMAGPSAAGFFQIALNVVNVTNPIMNGVCNVVPIVASRAARAGNRASWNASWPSIGAGLSLVAFVAATLMVFPEQIFHLLYSHNAQPARAIFAVRVLALGSLCNYAAVTLCAYLNGILAGRDCALPDLGSTATVIFAGPILISAHGLDGGAVALLLSFAVRAALLGLFAARRVLTPASRDFSLDLV